MWSAAGSGGKLMSSELVPPDERGLHSSPEDALRWMDAQPALYYPVGVDPLGAYCQQCSAGVGTPCSDLFGGGELEGFHRSRVHLAHAQQESP